MFALAMAATLSLAGAAACGRSTPGPRDVTIVSLDGFKLAATLYGKGTNGVVLTPDANETKDSLAEIAQEFASKGMVAIALNPRGFPGSDGARDYQIMDRDLIGSARYLQREENVTKIAYLGVGAGGTVCYKSAASPDVQASSMAAISSPVKFQSLDATTAAMQLFIPKMLVEAADNPEALQQARDTFKLFPDPKRLEEVPGTLRSTELLNSPDSAGLRSTIVDYIKKAFG